MVTMHQRQRKVWQDTQPREIEPGDLIRHYPTPEDADIGTAQVADKPGLLSKIAGWIKAWAS